MVVRVVFTLPGQNSIQKKYFYFPSQTSWVDIYCKSYIKHKETEFLGQTQNFSSL